jgi:hypothetical protein
MIAVTDRKSVEISSHRDVCVTGKLVLDCIMVMLLSITMLSDTIDLALAVHAKLREYHTFFAPHLVVTIHN